MRASSVQKARIKRDLNQADYLFSRKVPRLLPDPQSGSNLGGKKERKNHYGKTG